MTTGPGRAAANGAAAADEHEPTSVPSQGPPPGTATPARLVAIGGGKGGIGKSAVAAMLAVEMARRGLRT
ncbi:MAG: P-loop NTPase, partial [Thermoanaerobaculaceae bacterium]|nr:P-loop NTPase [Thermoanaerobaculaceae bacterium]